MDNWQGCSESGRGFISKRQKLNIGMGMGHESYDEKLAGWASDYRISENNHRNYYRRWGQMMSGAGWSEL